MLSNTARHLLHLHAAAAENDAEDVDDGVVGPSTRWGHMAHTSQYNFHAEEARRRRTNRTRTNTYLAYVRAADPNTMRSISVRRMMQKCTRRVRKKVWWYNGYCVWY